MYGLGLIGEEKANNFKTYHFDYRGSTVAITDIDGTVTDTFKYDAYGKLIDRTGTSYVIFRYNGRDGAVSDRNGLVYMRARYYSPEHKRFVNADILHGGITDSTSLNRYAYVNGNPVSFVDPTGMTADSVRGVWRKSGTLYGAPNVIYPNTNSNKQNVDLGLDKEIGSGSSYGISAVDLPQIFATFADGVDLQIGKAKFVKNGDFINIKGDALALAQAGIPQRRIKIDNLDNFPEIAKYISGKQVVSETFPLSSKAVNIIKNGKTATNAFKAADFVGVAGDIFVIGLETVYEVSRYEDAEDKFWIGAYTVGTGAVSSVASTAAGAGATWVVGKICASAGTAIYPGVGTLVGLGVGLIVGAGLDLFFDHVQVKYVEEALENN